MQDTRPGSGNGIYKPVDTDVHTSLFYGSWTTLKEDTAPSVSHSLGAISMWTLRNLITVMKFPLWGIIWSDWAIPSFAGNICTIKSMTQWTKSNSRKMLSEATVASCWDITCIVQSFTEILFFFSFSQDEPSTFRHSFDFELLLIFLCYDFLTIYLILSRHLSFTPVRKATLWQIIL